MANVKISDLAAFADPDGDDVFPIVDTSADSTKKVSITTLMRSAPDGTASAPAIAFRDDRNTGFYTPAENEIGFVTGGVQRLAVNSSGQVGLGTSSPDELLHLSASNPRLVLTDSDTGVDHRFNANSSVGNFTIDVDYNSEASTPSLIFRVKGSQRLLIDSSGVVTVNSGFVTLNGSKVGGIQVTIANDAFAEITPPKVGAGYIAVTEGPDETLPTHGCHGFVYCDWGNSAAVSSVNLGAKFETSTSGPPDGTTGSDDHATLFAGGTSGKVYLENRLGSTGIFALTFT